MSAGPDPVEPRQQAELRQFLGDVRQRVDTDAELADAVRLLVDLAVTLRACSISAAVSLRFRPQNDDGFHDDPLSLAENHALSRPRATAEGNKARNA